MPPGRRSAVGLVAQNGITSFISWFEDPKSIPWIAADVFGAAPRELLRSVSLTQTLQLIRITVEVVEERVKYDNELPSRIAALGWNGHGEVCVLVGTAPKMLDVDQLRKTARHLDADVLIGVQGNRLVLVIGRATDPEETDSATLMPWLEIATQLEPGF